METRISKIIFFSSIKKQFFSQTTLSRKPKNGLNTFRIWNKAMLTHLSISCEHYFQRTCFVVGKCSLVCLFFFKVCALMEWKCSGLCPLWQILELVKGMHYQLACQKYFELTHNVSRGWRGLPGAKRGAWRLRERPHTVVTPVLSCLSKPLNFSKFIIAFRCILSPVDTDLV